MAVAILLGLLAPALLALGNATGEPAAKPSPTSLAALFPRTSEHDFEAPKPGTYSLPVIKPASDGEVLDHEGRAVKLSSILAGKVSLLSFIYTSCSDAEGCPLATGLLYDVFHASEQAPLLARHVRLVSLSFDPERDTPEVMASYGIAALADTLRNNKMSWRFLTTRSQAALDPMLRAYGQVVTPNADGQTLYHLLRLYLIDRQGRVRNIYGLGQLDPRLLLADVETLLIEDGLAGGS